MVLEQRQENKTTGTYFTPEWLIDRLIDDVFDKSQWNQIPTVCDPSCGVGFFLLRWLDRLVEIESQSTRASLVTERIYGVDINPQSVQLAQLLLWWSVGDKEFPFSVLKHHSTGDALLGWSPSAIVPRGFWLKGMILRVSKTIYNVQTEHFYNQTNTLDAS